ncbi:MAG: MFS transporter, partial [Methyloceanibacter sp.]
AALLTRNSELRIDPLRTDEPFGDAEWAQASGVLRTFPNQLRLDSPEWSGMDGFFAARVVTSE